jgi:hypothetical protein
MCWLGDERNGIKVRQYVYSDIDGAAQRIAAHRVKLLQAAYPHLLETDALQGCFNLLPADVTQVSCSHNWCRSDLGSRTLASLFHWQARWWSQAGPPLNSRNSSWYQR